MAFMIVVLVGRIRVLMTAGINGILRKQVDERLGLMNTKQHG